VRRGFSKEEVLKIDLRRAVNARGYASMIERRSWIVEISKVLENFNGVDKPLFRKMWAWLEEETANGKCN
jgi:hypothetical protein